MKKISLRKLVPINKNKYKQYMVIIVFRKPLSDLARNIRKLSKKSLLGS